MPRKKRHAPAKKTLHPANDHRGPDRPAWQGHMRLSLVSCPVALVNATTRAHDISFHLINPETNNRIKMIATDPDSGPVERSELVKGYEIAKEQYVLLTPEDFESVKLETTHTLDIERFVDADTIDRIYWDNPYFLVPNGDEGIDAYAVIHNAMVKANRMALGRVVMHARERLIAIEPRGKGLMAYTLRMENEVRDSDDAFSKIPAVRPDKEMTDIALKIVEQKEGPFDPGQFVDRYEQSLKQLIREKQKGHKPVRAAEPEDTNVIDLMQALKKSLNAKGSAPKKSPVRKQRRRA